MTCAMQVKAQADSADSAKAQQTAKSELDSLKVSPTAPAVTADALHTFQNPWALLFTSYSTQRKAHDRAKR